MRIKEGRIGARTWHASIIGWMPCTLGSSEMSTKLICLIFERGIYYQLGYRFALVNTTRKSVTFFFLCFDTDNLFSVYKKM